MARPFLVRLMDSVVPLKLAIICGDQDFKRLMRGRTAHTYTGDMCVV
jgi:hypothetical protein